MFFIILFNYVFANGDAHLKNFSLYESVQGDYILTPAYDLLNTRIHFPHEPTATGLDFFADGHFSSRYEELGFYTSADFIELGSCFGVGEREVRDSIDLFISRLERVKTEIKASQLSSSSKERYLSSFLDRMKAVSM